MYNRLLRMPVVYVIQSLATSSRTSLSNPVTPNTVNNSLQLSDVILEDPADRSEETSPGFLSLSLTFPSHL
jgi:hypothetical protein